MLAQISISNYTIVSSLEVEFSPGMTVITGETGAGKSIMLDALGLCLGDRADPKTVRHGCERAEIIASFDLAAIPQAIAWLQDRDLHSGNECLLRRVLTADGRSRAYINGSVSTLQDCAELGTLLIDIHSQHAHQSLLRKSMQRDLLDAYADHKPLTRAVEQCASDWLRKRRELELLANAKDEHTSRMQLLSYQVEELDALNLLENELGLLEREQNLLANAEDILQEAHRALELCDDQESGVRQALKLLSTGIHATAAATGARELLESVAIQLTEARSELQRHIDSVEVDPERLVTVQRRLENIYDIARKHRVVPERLAALHRSLQDELQGLANGGQRIDQLDQEMAELARQYATDAARLGKQRRAAAKKLVKHTSSVLASLAMEGCQFEIALTPLKSDHPHPHGSEDIEFLISTNPGAPPRALGKIASGGELSRISLAIGVVTANTATVPSMVFDEVDVGIGGAVAEVVGRLLHTLAERAQVLCVTHLAQVAAQGTHHLQVTKASNSTGVETSLRRLDNEEKVQEIARMLGGVRITPQTLAHAREMLAS
ncbi:MAG TPA: DNA repair protein RecN [Halioglobus sp.]